MQLRKSVKSFKDAEYNFRMIDRLIRGHGLDEAQIRDVPSVRLTGDIIFHEAGVARLRITSDRVQMFTSAGHEGGFLLGEEVAGRPSLSMISSWQTRMLSVDAFNYQDRYVLFKSRVDTGSALPPVAYIGAVDKVTGETSAHLHLSKNIICAAKGNIGFFAEGSGAELALESEGKVTIRLGGEGKQTDRYEMQKNGTDGPGIINFKCP